MASEASGVGGGLMAGGAMAGTPVVPELLFIQLVAGEASGMGGGLMAGGAMAGTPNPMTGEPKVG